MSQSPSVVGPVRSQCPDCRGVATHQVGCPSAHVPLPRFVAVQRGVMLGPNCVAVGHSSTWARRIANALNRYIPSERGD